MAAKKKTTSTKTPDVVVPVSRERLTACILGTTPLIHNRLSEKAKRELLLPSGRKTAAQKATSLKHDPIAEYRASAHLSDDNEAPTRVLFPSLAFKAALRAAALDQPTGVSKASVGRLVSVGGGMVSVYGIPTLRMDIVRSADVRRTPDVRTRLVMDRWACVVTFDYSVPLISLQTVATLLGAAGITVGVGDWRPEKGAGDFGQFEVVDQDDTRFRHVLEHGGREVQDDAIKDPYPANTETRELLDWFELETNSRGTVVPSMRSVA